MQIHTGQISVSHYNSIHRHVTECFRFKPTQNKRPCTIPLNIITAVANKLKCEMFVTRYAVLSRDVTMHPEPVKNRLRC